MDNLKIVVWVMMRKNMLLAMLCWSAATWAQTGLQGFDRNYPDTPAGDNPRGFTPQISPLQKAPPTQSVSGSTNNASSASDPFTTSDPMLDGHVPSSGESEDEIAGSEPE